MKNKTIIIFKLGLIFCISNLFAPGVGEESRLKDLINKKFKVHLKQDGENQTISICLAKDEFSTKNKYSYLFLSLSMSEPFLVALTIYAGYENGKACLTVFDHDIPTEILSLNEKFNYAFRNHEELEYNLGHEGFLRWNQENINYLEKLLWDKKSEKSLFPEDVRMIILSFLGRKNYFECWIEKYCDDWENQENKKRADEIVDKILKICFKCLD